jgi:hypothetical protein
MFVFGSRVSEDSDQLAERTRTVTGVPCGCTGRAAMSPDPRFEMRELGGIDMVSGALAMLCCGELAGLAGAWPTRYASGLADL